MSFETSNRNNFNYETIVCANKYAVKTVYMNNLMYYNLNDLSVSIGAR